MRKKTEVRHVFILSAWTDRWKHVSNKLLEVHAKTTQIDLKEGSFFLQCDIKTLYGIQVMYGINGNAIFYKLFTFKS